MKKKTVIKLSAAALIVAGALTTTAFAADLEAGEFKSLKVGSQGLGGVTFFNGTIVNSTTGDDNSDNPVTFGDDVRIDGAIKRGPDSEDMPVKFADDVVISGTLKDSNGVTFIGGTHRLTIPANAFNPADSSIPHFLIDSDASGGKTTVTLRHDSDTSEYFYAPVNLPVGASVKSIKMIYTDETTQEMGFQFFKASELNQEGSGSGYLASSSGTLQTNGKTSITQTISSSTPITVSSGDFFEMAALIPQRDGVASAKNASTKQDSLVGFVVEYEM